MAVSLVLWPEWCQLRKSYFHIHPLACVLLGVSHILISLFEPSKFLASKLHGMKQGLMDKHSSWNLGFAIHYQVDFCKLWCLQTAPTHALLVWAARGHYTYSRDPA